MELSLSFASAGNLNEEILILAECNKIGKNFAYSQAEVYSAKDLSIIATGK